MIREPRVQLYHRVVPDPENVNFLFMQSQIILFGMKTCFKTMENIMESKHVLMPYSICFTFCGQFEIFCSKSVLILCGDIYSIITNQIRSNSGHSSFDPIQIFRFFKPPLFLNTHFTFTRPFLPPLRNFHLNLFLHSFNLYTNFMMKQL